MRARLPDPMGMAVAASAAVGGVLRERLSMPGSRKSAVATGACEWPLQLCPVPESDIVRAASVGAARSCHSNGRYNHSALHLLLPSW